MRKVFRKGKHDAVAAASLETRRLRQAQQKRSYEKKDNHCAVAATPFEINHQAPAGKPANGRKERAGKYETTGFGTLPRPVSFTWPCFPLRKAKRSAAAPAAAAAPWAAQAAGPVAACRLPGPHSAELLHGLAGSCGDASRGALQIKSVPSGVLTRPGTVHSSSAGKHGTPSSHLARKGRPAAPTAAICIETVSTQLTTGFDIPAPAQPQRPPHELHGGACTLVRAARCMLCNAASCWPGQLGEVRAFFCCTWARVQTSPKSVRCSRRRQPGVCCPQAQT